MPEIRKRKNIAVYLILLGTAFGCSAQHFAVEPIREEIMEIQNSFPEYIKSEADIHDLSPEGALQSDTLIPGL